MTAAGRAWYPLSAGRRDPERLERRGEPDHEAEAKDQIQAERADRLRRFVSGEAIPGIWCLDLLPLLESVHGDCLNMALDGKSEALFGVKVVQDIVHRLGGTIKMGEAAMHRIAVRRLGGENGQGA